MRKQTFITIFIAISVIMMVLPFLMTFSAALTKIFMTMKWYMWLQETVVPYEARLVAVLVRVIGVPASVTNDTSQFVSMMLERRNGGYTGIELQWNCLGWQSMILLGLTLIGGLKGPYTKISKIEVIMLGVVGTFLINIFRMSFIVALAYYWNDLAVKIMHDYFATLVAFLWMLIFWRFSYTYLLEEHITRSETPPATNK